MAGLWIKLARKINYRSFFYEGLTNCVHRSVLPIRHSRAVSVVRNFQSSTKPQQIRMETAEVVDKQLNVEQSEAPDEAKPQRRDWPWRKAKKVAVMLSFCGKDYIGMQRNPGFKTIEEELMRAFRDSGAIPDEWYENMQQAFFQRASRTDKGVSAAKMIVSLKLLCDDDVSATISKINSFLPPDIRVQAIKRVTKNFNSKTACNARTYLYLTPTFAFAPIFPTDVIKTSTADNGTTTSDNDSAKNGESYLTNRDFRLSSERREKVNHVLKLFVGSHYFHNYTSGKLPLEPSSQRFIFSFECGEPFIRSGMEFVVLKVKGQSFMLHQIRKMVGMTMAVVRGHASVDTIEQTWGVDRIDIPRAPGLGLLLEEVHYDRYNKRFGKDGFHDTLTWNSQAKLVEDFKEKFIFPEMIEGELKENSMFEWLKCLPIHTFEPRHFENDEPSKSALNAAAKRLQAQGDDYNAKRSKLDDDEDGGDDDE